MGEFGDIAERLAGIIDKLGSEGGIRARDIPQLVGDVRGQGQRAVNCYPGVKGADCHQMAFFVSLNSPSYKRGKGHLTCRKAIERLVQHMQGGCNNRTANAIIITDSWDAKAVHDWEASIQAIKASASVEAYLIAGGNATKIMLC